VVRGLKAGGGVAGYTRRIIERKLGTDIISSENYLKEPEERKRMKKLKEKNSD